METFYKTVPEVFAGGNLGGVRITGVKKSSSSAKGLEKIAAGTAPIPDSYRLLFAVLLLVQLYPPLLLSLAVLVLAVVVGSVSAGRYRRAVRTGAHSLAPVSQPPSIFSWLS